MTESNGATLVMVLYVEDLDEPKRPTRILGVFRNSETTTGFEAARVRACFEPGTPAVPDEKHWTYIEGDSMLRSHWTYESRDKAFIIEAHVLEPLDSPPPRVGRRPGPGI